MAQINDQTIKVPNLNPNMLKNLSDSNNNKGIYNLSLSQLAPLSGDLGQSQSIAGQNSVTSSNDGLEQLNRGKWTPEEDDELRRAVGENFYS